MSLLAAAQGGNERAFEELVAGHRRELHVHCYRMLGNLADAEDALQETLLTARRGIAGFEGRSSLRAWLFLIASHCCMRLARVRPARVLSWHLARARDPMADIGSPVTDTVYLEPWPGEDDAVATRDDVGLELLAALQHLSPDQRAVLLLREVSRFDADEVAAMLDTSPAAVNSALLRARAAVDARVPAHVDPPLPVEQEQQVVAAFVDAWERSDVPGVVGMLGDDVRLTLPPLRAWFDGRDDVAQVVEHRVLTTPWRLKTVVANQRPALACYQLVDGTYRLTAVGVLHLQGDRVRWIALFLDPPVLARFELPPTV